MSHGAIQEVVRALELLPESEHETLLAFVRALRKKRHARRTTRRRARNPALRREGSVLVFTGEADAHADWLETVREEQLQHLASPGMRACVAS